MFFFHYGSVIGPFSCRIQCLQRLFQQTIEHVKSLYVKEDWVLKEPDSVGYPGYTQLCCLFESNNKHFSNVPPVIWNTLLKLN